MTYRQLFDEAIGEPPPSSVDVTRVVAREDRRARVRRTGAAGAAAVAVLAAAIGVGAMRDALPFADPTPGVLAASAEQAADGAADRQRIRDAMLAALEREAPELGWVLGAGTGGSDRWNGPITTKPVWHVNQFSDDSASGWVGSGVAAREEVRAFVSIAIGTPKAHRTDPLKCPGHSRGCTISHGPNGERIRSVDFDAFEVRPGDPPSGPHKPVVHRDVEIFRPDGTEISVKVHGAAKEFLLSTEQMVKIGLDPALSLH